MRTVTASQMELAMLCAGSFLLPRAGRIQAASDRGNGIHGFMQHAIALGVDVAVQGVDEEYQDECRRIDIDPIRRLIGNDEAHYEEAVAWSVDTDAARSLGVIGRDYKVEDDEICGTPDLLVVRDGSVLVADYKTGHSDVTPAAQNWQLRTLAVMAAKLYGVDTVDVAILKLREDGGWWTDMARFDALDLDGFAATIRRRLMDLSRSDYRYGTTGVLDVIEGSHCQWCPSMAYCPAKNSLMRTLANQLSKTPEAYVSEMSDADAGLAFVQLERVQEFVDRARRAIEERAAVNPLPLPDGRQVCVVESQREFVSGPVVQRVMTEEYGAEVAAKVCETVVKSSKDAITKALGKESRRALQLIGERGGLVIKKSKRIKAA